MKAFVILNDKGRVSSVFVGNKDHPTTTPDMTRAFRHRLEALGYKVATVQSDSMDLLEEYVAGLEAESHSDS